MYLVNIQGMFTFAISTVHETCLDDSFLSSAYFLSSPVTKSHGVP